MQASIEMRVTFSPHAIERFQSRVRPALDLPGVRAELAGLVSFAQISARPPAWVQWDERADMFLVIADAVLPLRATNDGYVATTSLVKGSFSPEKRAVRSARKARRARLVPGIQ